MTQMSIDQALETAVRHHTAGELSQAEQIYRQVLAVDPNNVDALHLLGQIALQSLMGMKRNINVFRSSISLNLMQMML